MDQGAQGSKPATSRESRSLSDPSLLASCTSGPLSAKCQSVGAMEIEANRRPLSPEQLRLLVLGFDPCAPWSLEEETAHA